VAVAVSGVPTRLAALRDVPPRNADGETVPGLPDSVFEALPAGLRLVDVMELSLEAVRTTVMRRTLTDHPPDVLVTIPRSSCRTLDFHKAEAMIELGRRLATEALDHRDDVSPSYATGAPQLSAS
jgi:NTE family protein